MNGSRKTNLIAWVTILSLDAPLVALVWQAFFARLLDVSLPPAARLILVFTVWLAYVADRWLDGRQMPAGSAVTLRHRFAQRHARPIAVAWLLVFIGDVLLALIGLSRMELLKGVGMGAAVLLYLTLIHLPALRKPLGSVKELLVAALFSAGCLFFVAIRLPAVSQAVVICFFSLTGIALFNCLAVSAWERAEDARQTQSSMAIHWRIQPGTLGTILVILGMVFAVMAFLTVRQPLFWLAVAGMISTFGMRLLIRLDLPPEVRRLLADIALLSPLLFLWVV